MKIVKGKPVIEKPMWVTYGWVFAHGDLHKTCVNCLGINLLKRTVCVHNVMLKDVETGEIKDSGQKCGSVDFMPDGGLDRKIRFMKNARGLAKRDRMNKLQI
jgi:hypothetical protein